MTLQVNMLNFWRHLFIHITSNHKKTVTQTTATNNHKLYNKQQKYKNYRKTILTAYAYDCLIKSHKYNV